MHGFIFNKEEAQCVADPDWAQADSEVIVRANKKTIDQCEEVKVRIDPHAGFDPEKGLSGITWNILIDGTEMAGELHLILQRILREADGKSSFTFDNQFTSMLDIGTTIKVIGFADDNHGSTVTDTETIVVESAPLPVLTYERSFFIAAEDGLRMDLRKTHGKCPNAHTTEKILTSDDLDRLTCSLLSINKEFITELPRGC